MPELNVPPRRMSACLVTSASAPGWKGVTFLVTAMPPAVTKLVISSRGGLADRVADGDLHAGLLLAWLAGPVPCRGRGGGAWREDRVGNRALVGDADHGAERTAERLGELAGLRLGVLDRGGAGSGQQRAGVGQVQ